MKINEALKKFITIALIFAMAVTAMSPLSVFAQPGDFEASGESGTPEAPEIPAEENPQDPVPEYPITEDNGGDTNAPGESESVDLVSEEAVPEYPSEVETALELSEINSPEELAEEEQPSFSDEVTDEDEPAMVPLAPVVKMQSETDIVVADWIRLRSLVQRLHSDDFDGRESAVGNVTHIIIHPANTEQGFGTPVPGGGADWRVGGHYNLVLTEADTDLINSSGIDSTLVVRRNITLVAGSRDIRILHSLSSTLQRHFRIENHARLTLGNGIILDGQRSGTQITGGGVQIDNTGTLEMLDGSMIRNNRGISGNAGGVIVNNGGTFTMRGGVVNHNTSNTNSSASNGVVMHQGGTINVGGNARIGNGLAEGIDNNTILRENNSQVINILPGGLSEGASITILSRNFDVTGTVLARMEGNEPVGPGVHDKFFYTNPNHRVMRQSSDQSNVILYGLDWIRLREVIGQQVGIGTNQVRIHHGGVNPQTEEMDWVEGNVYNLVISDTRDSADITNNSTVSSAIDVTRGVMLTAAASEVRMLHPTSNFMHRHFTVSGENGHLILGRGITLDGQRTTSITASGGGVTVNAGGTLEMLADSKIMGNRGRDEADGGVQVNSGGTLTMKSGEIVGNISSNANNLARSGVVMREGATINFGGNAKIGTGSTLSTGNNGIFRESSNEVIDLLPGGLSEGAILTIIRRDFDYTGILLARRSDGKRAEPEDIEKVIYTDINYRVVRQAPESPNIILYGIDWVRLRDVVERVDGNFGGYPLSRINQIRIHRAGVNSHTEEMDWVDDKVYNLVISDPHQPSSITNGYIDTSFHTNIIVEREITLTAAEGSNISLLHPTNNGSQRHFRINARGHLILSDGITLDGQRNAGTQLVGGGVTVNSEGIFEMLDGSAIRNVGGSNNLGATVEIVGGTFTMRGGKLVDNLGQNTGHRGVRMRENATLNVGGSAQIGVGNSTNDNVTRFDSNQVINILDDGFKDGAIITVGSRTSDEPGTRIAQRLDGEEATIRDLDVITYLHSSRWTARETKGSPNIVLGWRVTYEFNDNETPRIFSRVGHEAPYKYGTAEWPEIPMTETSDEDVKLGILGWFTVQTNFTPATQRFPDNPVTSTHELWARRGELYRISIREDSEPVTVTGSTVRIDEFGVMWAPAHTTALPSVINLSATPPTEEYSVIWTVTDRAGNSIHSRVANSTSFNMPAFGVTVHARFIHGDVTPTTSNIDFGRLTRPTFTPLFFTLNGSTIEGNHSDVLIGVDASQMEEIVFNYPLGFNKRLDLTAGPFFQINEDGEYVENIDDPNSQVFSMVAWERGTGNRPELISADLSGDLRVRSIFEGNGQTSWTWNDLRYEILISLDAFHTLREPLGLATEARYRSVFTWEFFNIP